MIEAELYEAAVRNSLREVLEMWASAKPCHGHPPASRVFTRARTSKQLGQL